jgi:hypothetical protein
MNETYQDDSMAIVSVEKHRISRVKGRASRDYAGELVDITRK